MFGIIGGTGLTQLDNLMITHRRIARTPYGDASQPLLFGKLAGHEVVFLARHGGGHTIPPHEVNYRANIWALHSVGVKHLLAIATVGGIAADLAAGDIVLPHQIIDYTHGRNNTYHDGLTLPVKHIDFTEPYSTAMRVACQRAANNIGQVLHNGGTYACVQGPRLETAAEIDRYERDGATVIGMTGMPEASLARELDIEYAALCPVANQAAGRGDSRHGIKYETMVTKLAITMQQIRGLIEEVVKVYAESIHGH